MARSSAVTVQETGLGGTRRLLSKINMTFLLWVATVVLLAVSGYVSPGFIQPENLLRLFRQAVPFGFVAIGQTFAILTGHVDLSVQAVTVFSGMLGSTFMMGSNANLLPAFLKVAAMTVTFGLLNGLGVTKLGINPFVMTFGTGITLDGLTMVFTGGATHGTASPILKFIGTGRFFNFLPVSILIWIGASILAVVVLRSTTFGRRVYAVGANKRVAQLSGINSDAVIIGVYVLSALMATIAGFIVCGYIGTGTLDLGDDYKMISMAAVIMGGTLFRGGVGGYTGTASAVVTLTALTGLLTILQITEPIRRIIYGLIILGVLAATSRTKRG
ncbi:MAG: ABC transporter permease [Chitinophagales bacterium]